MPALARLLRDVETCALLECLKAADEEARIVGGAIRNAMMGRAVSDIDIATTCLPQVVIERARAAGWKPVPTGLAHGTITVVIEGRPFEVTTLREDVETDGRHARVVFGRDFRTDAARRDFTINAMSMGLDGQVQDYFDGTADIAARRVRFIGDPAQRLREDYLRGLRFLRFSATYGEGQLDPVGFAAVLTHRDGLGRLSGERVRQELFKLLLSEHAVATLEASEIPHRLLEGVLGVPLDRVRFAQFVTSSAPSSEGNLGAISRLFALCVKAQVDINALRGLLKLSNLEMARLQALLGAIDLLDAGASLRETAYRFTEAWPDALRMCNRRANPEADDREAMMLTVARPAFALSGKDLVARGFPAGPELGEALSRLEARWIAIGLPTGREAQLALLDDIERQG